MIPDDLEFHHIGLAASRPKRATDFLTALGYACTESIYDPVQNVRLVMCTHVHAPSVEIISPSDTPGPLDSILRDAKQSIYHVCYETKDLDATLKRFAESGVRAICISEPKPAILFGNRPVSFYMIGGFGLIELLDTGGAVD
jgi:methylmalonyl-CoA/ethylmalonyl-CoA epimerase